MDNALVLSEELEESAVLALINIAIADLFPGPCDKWRATNQDIRTRHQEEFGKRKDIVHQEIARGRDSLRRTLREVVVEDVLRLFPYVLVCDVLDSDNVLLVADHWNMTTSLPAFRTIIARMSVRRLLVECFSV
jgi:hypothetical protein